jgi:transcriptional regulator with XRE-family HTH domain
MPVPETATPGSRLRAAIAALGITPAEAARRIGTNRQALNNVLTGRKTPTLDWLHSAAGKLGVDPAALDDRLAPRD